MRLTPFTVCASLARLARLLGALVLAVALTAGCSFSGRIVAPTAQPIRLLDPTAPVQLPAPTRPGMATTPVPTATPAPAARTLLIVGVVESIAGEIWVIDGVRVRVPPGAVVGPGLAVGSLVRVVARVQDDDDDDQTITALRVEPVGEVVLVGQLIALDGVSLTVDGRVLVLPAGFVVPPGVAPGVIVRVVARDDGGRLTVLRIEPLAEARVLGGVVELIDGNIIVIGGQRLILAPDVVLWRVRLALGEPVRIIVVPVNGVLTIVSITIITIVVPPPVVVVPIPEPTVIVVVVPPAPRPAPPPARGGDDDDDDDDD